VCAGRFARVVGSAVLGVSAGSARQPCAAHESRPSRAAASFSARAARALASAARRRSICAGSVIGRRVRFGFASAITNG